MSDVEVDHWSIFASREKQGSISILMEFSCSFQVSSRIALCLMGRRNGRMVAHYLLNDFFFLC
jgi:hypothetical protein